MPREKKLRRQLKISEATLKEIKIIQDTQPFNFLAKPDHPDGILSVKINGQLIGWGQIRQGANNEVEIERIEILKQYRKRGLGRKVIGKINAILLRRRVRQIILYGELANGFYNKTNFRPTNFMGERIASFKKRKK